MKTFDVTQTAMREFAALALLDFAGLQPRFLPEMEWVAGAEPSETNL